MSRAHLEVPLPRSPSCWFGLVSLRSMVFLLRRSFRLGPRAITAGLFVLGALYLGLAFPRLVSDVEGSYPIDLRLRWVEHRFLAQGLNPQRQGHPDVPDSHAPMRTQGGSYPPWAYTIGSLFVPPLPAFAAVRWYYAALCAVAMAVLVTWAHRHAGWIGAGGVVAIFPAAICVSYGQYAVVIAALLAGAEWLIGRGRPVIAGIALGLTTVKPNLCALFLLVTLLHGHYRAVLAAAATVLVASVAASWMASTPLSVMLANFGSEAGMYYWLSHNPLLPWLTRLIGFEFAVAVLAVAGITTTVAVWVLHGREASLAHSFAIAAAVTMFWSYRRHYDTVLMALMFAPLIGIALAHGPRARLVAVLVGMTLWAPLRHTTWNQLPVQVIDLVLWVAAMVMIVAAQRQRSGVPSDGILVGPPETVPVHAGRRKVV